ncbi:MAG: agmatinase [Defluviitaleaceae bacterium]|nr:agmatinase [Defluviitaleaceae bacterium]
MPKINFSNPAQFLGMETPYEASKVVVFGAPFDGTTSNKAGTKFAANAMRLESEGLETYSPLLDLDLEAALVYDAGNIELSYGVTTRVMSELEAATSRLLADGKIPLMIGGEHLVSYPVVKAIAKLHPDVHIIHLDAHTDLRDEFGGSPLSHATVLKRIWDLLGDGRIFQFGIRSGTKAEFDFARQAGHTYLEAFRLQTVGHVLEQLSGKKVYVTIDLDVLDPSMMSGTGTPEAGGITYRELESFFLLLRDAHVDIVGADVVELSPGHDPSGVSTATACKVLREMALILNNNEMMSTPSK